MAEERLGASFSIDITQLKAGLNTANKLIKETQTQFQKAAAGLQDWTKNENALNAKITSLNRIIPVQEEKVRALKEQYEKLSKDGMKETEDRAIQLRTQINREEAALESNRAELKRQEEALEEVKKASDDAGDSIEETGDKANDTSGKFTVMKGALASLVADGFRMAIDAAKQFATELVNVGITFDDSMAKVAAVSGATETELEQLRAKAKELGESTKFTASESAEAFNYMAMAGWKTEDMLNGIEGILNLAAASGADLATTSDIVTDALTAMGYEAKDAGRLADVMAAASSNANTNVEMMGLTFQYAAPLVGALGYSMEDTAKAIGLMANSGVKGEKAGTALRSIFTRLANPPKDCAESLKELGVSLTDSSGKMKSFDTVMQDLRKAFVNLDEVEKATHASNIAGQEALSGMLAIVNAAPEDYAKLTAAINDSEGAAQNMADTMLDTLGGDMTVLNSQLEGVRLTIYEQLSPTLRDLVSDAQKWLGEVDWKSFGKKASDALKSIIDYGKKLGKSILPVLKTALNFVGKALKFVIDNFSWLSKVVLIAVTAFKAFKAVMAVTTAITAAKTAIAGLTAGVGLATKAQTAWNAVMAANPIGAVITAVALLAGGIAVLVGAQKDEISVENQLSEAQKEHRAHIDDVIAAVDDATSSYKDLSEQQQQIVDKGMSEAQYYEGLKTELDEIVTANGKIKEGYENRVDFILTQLKEGLGIEVEITDGVIQKYNELTKSIDDVIEKKKAQIILDSQEEKIKEALTNRNDTIKRQIELENELNALKDETVEKQEELDRLYDKQAEWWKYASSGAIESPYQKQISELEEYINAEENGLIARKNNAEAAYNEQKNLLESYAYDVGVYEANMAAAHAGEYEKMITVTWDYVSDYADAIDAEKKMTEDQILVTQTNLDFLKGLRDKYNTDIYDSQIKAAEDQLAALENDLVKYNSATEAALGENQVLWDDAIGKNLSEITGSHIEFKDAGEGMIQMLVDGQEEGAPKSVEEMSKLVNSIVQELIDEKPNMAEAGKGLLDGLNNGISDSTKQSGLFASISALGKALLSRFKKSLEEKSPSKATRQMGRYLIDGLGLGIKDEENGVLNQISRFGRNVVKSIQAHGKNVNFDGLASNVGAGLNVSGGGNVNNSKTVTVNQYNTYSQAHSRYELYKSKQQTAAAVRLALAGGV